MARTRGAKKDLKAAADPSLPPTRVIPRPEWKVLISPNTLNAPGAAAAYRASNYAAEAAAAEPAPPRAAAPGSEDAIPWGDYFDLSRPIDADIGCGMGRFILTRAPAHPERQYLGMELESARIVHIDVAARRAGLENLRLLQGDALRTLPLLPDAFLDLATVFFPDPWPKRKHWARRLVQEPFLDAVHRVLKPGALLHLATDQIPYFEDMVRLLSADARFERTETMPRTPEEWTDFERIFRAQGLPIGEGTWRKRGV